MKQIPLLSLHEKNAVEIGEFAGWKTVITFSSVREEHSAVRNSAAIFDISHMTRTKITGPRASKFLQELLTIDVEKLKQRRMKYGLMLNESGKIIDDVTVYKVDENTFLLVSNAVTRQRVVKWLSQHASTHVAVEDITDFSAFFAVQGPEAAKHLSMLFGDVSGFRWFEGDFRVFDGCQLLVTRSGYTGGDGFEIMVPCGGVELFEKIFSKFVGEGVKPAGLACRDVCRIEAGYPLSGQDFDESNSPAEAGLELAVKMDKACFIGKEALTVEPPKKKPVSYTHLTLPTKRIV